MKTIKTIYFYGNGEKIALSNSQDIYFKVKNVLEEEYTTKSRFNFNIGNFAPLEQVKRKNKENLNSNENYCMLCEQDSFDKNNYNYHDLYINSNDVKIEKMDDHIDEYEKGNEKWIYKQYKVTVLNKDFAFNVSKCKPHFLTLEEFKQKWHYTQHDYFDRLEDIVKLYKESSRFKNKKTLEFYQQKLNEGFYGVFYEHYYESVNEFTFRIFDKKVKSDLLIKQEKINELVCNTLGVNYIYKPNLLKLLSALNIDIDTLNIEELEKKLNN